MADDRQGVTTTRLVKVETRFTRHLHYAPDGALLTLCGRVALYQVRWGWPKPPCGRCTIEATTHGLPIPG